jgi:transposase InsO family protein
LGFWSLFLSSRRRARTAIILKPSSLFRFIRALKQRKYRLLFSSTRKSKPGPKGPAPELIEAILQLKRRNPRCGCPRIAQQIAETFGIKIDKDVVRRVLAAHYRPECNDDGPSWLTLLSQAKDSLWSVDLFRTECILLKSHWVLVIMDVCTRRIIGFGVQAIAVDGPALCRMFNQAISGQGLPTRLGLDHDPLFRFHRWQANLRILGIESVPTVPCVPGITPNQAAAQPPPPRASLGYSSCPLLRELEFAMDTSFTLLEGVERNAIVQMLNETGGNKLETAKQLGIGRQTLYNKIKAYGIEV